MSFTNTFPSTSVNHFSELDFNFLIETAITWDCFEANIRQTRQIQEERISSKRLVNPMTLDVNGTNKKRKLTGLESQLIVSNIQVYKPNQTLTKATTLPQAHHHLPLSPSGTSLASNSTSPTTTTHSTPQRISPLPKPHNSHYQFPVEPSTNGLYDPLTQTFQIASFRLPAHEILQCIISHGGGHSVQSSSTWSRIVSALNLPRFCRYTTIGEGNTAKEVRETKKVVEWVYKRWLVQRESEMIQDMIINSVPASQPQIESYASVPANQPQPNTHKRRRTIQPFIMPTPLYMAN